MSSAVHEDERAQVLHAAVAVVVRVDRRVPLVVRAHRAEDQAAVRRDGVGQRRVRELGAARRREEHALARRLRDAEAERLAHALVEVRRSPSMHLRHRVADAVVVVDVVLPRRLRLRAASPCAIPAMIAGSERRCGEAGSFMPCERCTMLIESSTRDALEAAALVVLLGAAEARQDQRLPAVHEVAAVQLRAHLHRQLAAAQRLDRVAPCRARRGRSCRPCRRRPSPRRAAWPRSCAPCRGPCSRGGSMPQTSASRSRNSGSGGGRCRRCGCPGRSVPADRATGRRPPGRRCRAAAAG